MFCARAIERPLEQLVVEDALTDERFCDHPSVLGPPFIRSYMGMPVVSPDGFALGTLCVIDMVPRSFTATQRKTLKTLANQVATKLELRLNVRLLEREIENRNAAENDLRRSAFRDELTGLPNRALILERITHAMTLRRGTLSSAAVMCVDIDDFQSTNATLGTAVGDSVLIAIGSRIAAVLRPEDTVGRYGGDRFVLVVQGIEGATGAESLAKRILTAFEAPVVTDGHAVAVRASVGITLLGPVSRSAQDVIRDADIAVHRAKASGGGRSGHLFPENHQRAVARLQLQSDLRTALSRSELCLYYQPIVALPEGAIAGFEALVRWQHPERGLVTPDEFISLAEESDLIEPIGDWVLTEAARQLQEWKRGHAAFSHLWVNVNVSARQFNAGTVYDSIDRALRATGLEPQFLIAEITETSLMKHPEAAAETIARLRELGVAVELDDFGCGYSSLGYLRNLPVGGLKIDRSFISGAGPGVAGPEIVTAVIGLASTLKLNVTAEGIETHEQLFTLRQQGCAYGQGYLFSGPLPADQVPGFLAGFALERVFPAVA